MQLLKLLKYHLNESSYSNATSSTAGWFTVLFHFKGKFQAFYQYAKTFNSDDFDYEDLKSSDYIFMRWKVRGRLRQA